MKAKHANYLISVLKYRILCINLANVGRLSKLFRCQIQQEICNKPIVTFPTTPYWCCYRNAENPKQCHFRQSNTLKYTCVLSAVKTKYSDCPPSTWMHILRRSCQSSVTLLLMRGSKPYCQCVHVMNFQVGPLLHF